MTTTTTPRLRFSPKTAKLKKGEKNFYIPLPHDKILDQTKLKAYSDDKLNVTKMIISIFDRVENNCGRRRNCLYKQFLLSHNVFKRFLSQMRQKVSLCGNGLSPKGFSKICKCTQNVPHKKCFIPSKISPFNPLPNNKILDQSKLKAFADDKINVT